MKFCWKCGQALLPSSTPFYDPLSGDKVLTTCPSGECEHAGLAHDYPPFSIWHFLFIKPRICKRCGKRDDMGVL